MILYSFLDILSFSANLAVNLFFQLPEIKIYNNYIVFMTVFKLLILHSPKDYFSISNLVAVVAIFHFLQIATLITHYIVFQLKLCILILLLPCWCAFSYTSNFMFLLFFFFKSTSKFPNTIKLFITLRLMIISHLHKLRFIFIISNLIFLNIT